MQHKTFHARNSKLILHYSNYSESSWGLNRNNSSDRTWMFREITRQQRKAVPAAASHLCRGWVAAVVAQTGQAAGRKKHLPDKNFTCWSITRIQTFGCLAAGVCIFWQRCTAVHLPVWKSQTCLFQSGPMDWKNWQVKVRHVTSIISTLIPGIEKIMKEPCSLIKTELSSQTVYFKNKFIFLWQCLVDLFWWIRYWDIMLI